MNNQNYLEHLSEIKDIIAKRSRFYALSGLSGILAGIYALIGAFLAGKTLNSRQNIVYDDLSDLKLSINILEFSLIFIVVFLLSILTGVYFTSKKAKKSGEHLWSKAAYQTLINFSLPMFVGAFFIAILSYKGFYDMISGTCLTFYGLALFNASNFTFSEIRYLALAMICTSFASFIFPGYGLYFWAFGFGVLHIIYGTFMHIKYEK